MQREFKRRRQTLRDSTVSAEESKIASKKSVEKQTSSGTPKESMSMLTSASTSACASASSLSSSSTAETAPNSTTGNQKNPKESDEKLNTKPKATGVHMISPSKSTKESSTLPLSLENAEPDYFEDLLQLAETKAREFESEKANAPVLLEQGAQCKMFTTGVDTEFLEEIKQNLFVMNARQKMHFKQKVYKSLMDVFDSAVDFPTNEQLTTISSNNLITKLENNLQPKEICLIRELVSLVLASKKTSDLINTASAPTINTAISNTTIGINNYTNNQTSNVINGQSNKLDKATQIVKAAAKPTKKSFPALISGSTSARTSGRAVTTLTAKKTPRITGSGIFIVPQTSSNISGNSTTTVTTATPSQRSVLTLRPITRATRPIAISPSSLRDVAGIPIFNRPNKITTNQSAVTISCLTQNQQQTKSQHTSMRTLNPTLNKVQTLRKPMRLYSICTFSNSFNSPIMNYNDESSDGRTKFSESIATARENTQRMNKPIASLKRTHSTNVRGTHNIATSCVIGTSAESAAATNVTYTNATSTTPFSAI